MGVERSATVPAPAGAGLRLSPKIARELRQSPYWRDGPHPEAPSHVGLFAPRIGPRPLPPLVFEEAEVCPWKVKPQHNSLQAINLVTGHLGSGKSYYAMRMIERYARAGKFVMCNFDLYGPWWSTFVDRTYSKKELYRVRTQGSSAAFDRDRYDRMRYILRHVWRFYDQSELYNYVLPGDPRKEDRGLLVVDEAALHNNARTGKERQQKAAERTGDALAEFEWFIHMRKLGWTCLMLTQDSDMVDKQLKGTTSSEVHLRNLAKVKIPFVGIPLARKPTFVAVYYWQEGAKKGQPVGRDYYGLDVRLANHYRSNHRFSRRDGEAGAMGPMYDYDAALVGQPVPFDPEIPVLPAGRTTTHLGELRPVADARGLIDERGTSEEEDEEEANRPQLPQEEEDDFPWLPESYGGDFG